jgi:glycerol-3-phosphate dehydrogenase
VPIVNTSKGLHTERLCLMTELVTEALGRTQPFSVISGPTFAQELMKGFPSGAVVASGDAALAHAVAALFGSPTLKVWTST